MSSSSQYPYDYHQLKENQVIATDMTMFQTPPLHEHDYIPKRELNALSHVENTILDGSVITAASSTKNTLFIEIVSHFLLFLLIFGMSGTVNTRSLRKQIGNKYAITIGLVMQFLVMPFLGFCAVMALQLEGLTMPMGITLLMVTASPGGSYSNFWCSIFNADLALSVAMTALSTIFSIVFLPANLILYSYAVYGRGEIFKSVDFTALFVSISLVITAIILGFCSSHYLQSKTFQRVANALGSMSGLALIIFSAIFSTTGTLSDEGDNKNPWNKPWSFYVGVLTPCLGGLLLANVIARIASLKKPEVVTISVECCYQNVGIATSAALSMFNDKTDIAEGMAIALFYGLSEAVVLAIYCLAAWKFGWTKAPKDEFICLTLTKSYEIEAEEIEEMREESNQQRDLERDSNDDEQYDNFEANDSTMSQSGLDSPMDKSNHTGTSKSSDGGLSFATSIRSWFVGNMDLSVRSFGLQWGQNNEATGFPENVRAGQSSASEADSVDNIKSKKSHGTGTTVEQSFLSNESADEFDAQTPGRVRSETDDSIKSP